MKKLFLLILTVLLTVPCFARDNARKTYFRGIPLTVIDSEKGTDVYQRAISKNKKSPAQTIYTLTIQEVEKDDMDQELDLFFWESLNERNEEGTYQQVRELTYNNEPGKPLDAYTYRTYLIENDIAIFELKRAKELEKEIRFYTFTFEQKLQGEDITFSDRYGKTYTCSPQEYFNFIVKHFTDAWVYEINHFILEVFNK